MREINYTLFDEYSNLPIHGLTDEYVREMAKIKDKSLSEIFKSLKSNIKKNGLQYFVSEDKSKIIVIQNGGLFKYVGRYFDNYDDAIIDMLDELEIERKFLLKYDDVNDLIKLSIGEKEIEQTYIYVEGDVEERVRKINRKSFYILKDENSKEYISCDRKSYNEYIGEKKVTSKISFTYTKKIGEGMVRKEFEEEISELVYNSLKKMIVGKSINKTRYSFENKNPKIIEIILDLYKDKSLAVSEIEYKNKESLTDDLPNILKNYVIKDITEEIKYSNKQMALNS